MKSDGVVRSWHYRKGLIPPISGNALVQQIAVGDSFVDAVKIGSVIELLKIIHPYSFRFLPESGCNDIVVNTCTCKS